MDNLANKKCVPCEAGTMPLEEQKVEEFQKKTPQWSIIEYKKIERDFVWKDFKEAIAFVNKVATVAESEGHHPDILVHGWNKVKITLWTHAIGGLSDNDFIMAAKIDAIL